MDSKMRRPVTTLFRYVAIAFTAVLLTDANLLLPVTTLDLGIGSTVLAACPPATKPPIVRGGIEPDTDYIISQCTEICQPTVGTAAFLSYQEDGTFDVIWVWCPSVQQARPIPSSSTCWNCVGSCAGPGKCPSGELCIPTAGQTGSDCVRYGCEAGYTISETGSNQPPVCVRDEPCIDPPPLTIQLDGPTVIRTGTTCTWSAQSSGGEPNTPRTYWWYHANGAVGSGPTYTGGRPSGAPYGSPWLLRVEVTDGETIVGTQIYVNESSNAMLCMN
jgi:hypothetical protein